MKGPSSMELVLRPAIVEHDDTDDTASEWIRTPSEFTFVDEDDGDGDGDDDDDQSEVQIDPYGDLLLRVGCGMDSGESPSSFRVCSNTLRRASPFWRRTLVETAAEAKALDEEEEEEEEEDPDLEWVPSSLFACPREKSHGLRILLNIIHLEFHQVPETPSLAEVYSALCLASMYEMEHVLQPWIGHWHAVVVRHAEGARSSTKGGGGGGGGDDLAMLVCIAWGLGDEKLFTRAVVKLALTCVANAEGRIATADGVWLDKYVHDSLGSPSILESIRSLRNQLMLELPSHTNRLIARLMEDGKWMCRGISDIPITKSKKCDYIVLGSLFAGMIHVRGSRSTELVARADESVVDLLKSIERVLSHVTCHEKHAECNPTEKIVDAMKETMEGMDTALSAATMQRMLEQRRKTGLEQELPKH